jgi:hypothetical protein
MRQCALLVLGLVLAVVMPSYFASAVGTSYWKQTSEADFKNGTLENVVATNLGDLKLSRAIKTLLDQDPQISTVNTMAEAPDGTIYAGTGPNAVLLQIKDEKVSTVTTIPDSAGILSILIDKKGAILLGTGGEKGSVVKIARPGAKPEVLLTAENVQYVWALAQTPDGNIYAATGPAGQLYEIKPDGSKRVLLETAESNLLSLVSDGKDLLYLGTDPHGLVYRVNRKTGESFVLYNAVESEVSALALDKNGNLYAGTSEAKEEPPPAPEPAAVPEKGGRPEGGAVGIPIPADRPKEPTPPPPPNPNPGQPDPIPKSAVPAPKAELHERVLMQRRAVASALRIRGIPMVRPVLSAIDLRRERESMVGQAFLPAIELVSGGHSCPPEPTRIRSGGKNASAHGFGQTRMSAPPKPGIRLYLKPPENWAHPPLPERAFRLDSQTTHGDHHTVMRRVSSIILILAFLALGSGATEFLHNAQHAAEDARSAIAQGPEHSPDSPVPAHDDSNCAVHLQLHLPALPAYVPPPALFVGLLIGLISVALPRVSSFRAPVLIDCRGPPRG